MVHIHRILARTLLLALGAGCALPGAALTLASTVDNGQPLAVTLAGPRITLDLGLLSQAPVTIHLALEAADLGQLLALDAVVGSVPAIDQVRLRLEGARWVLAGAVEPMFGQVASLDLTDTVATIGFAPAETAGFTLGAAFGRPGASDWLLQPNLQQAGAPLSLHISAVPEPAAWWLLAAGLPLLALRRRRR